MWTSRVLDFNRSPAIRASDFDHDGFLWPPMTLGWRYFPGGNLAIILSSTRTFRPARPMLNGVHADLVLGRGVIQDQGREKGRTHLVPAQDHAVQFFRQTCRQRALSRTGQAGHRNQHRLDSLPGGEFLQLLQIPQRRPMPEADHRGLQLDQLLDRPPVFGCIDAEEWRRFPQPLTPRRDHRGAGFGRVAACHVPFINLSIARGGSLCMMLSEIACIVLFPELDGGESVVRTSADGNHSQALHGPEHIHSPLDIPGA